MKNVSSSGLIALMVLAAPALAVTPTTVPNCFKDKEKKDQCTVFVLVNGNTCGGGIAMSPDPLITKAGSGPITITWKLVGGGGWEFDPRDGIIVVDGNKDVVVGGTKLKDTWTATTSTGPKMIWHYDVNLVRTVGKVTEKCSRDPTIVNK